jgi:RNA polymerase sigma factor (sigma-70 family)
MPALSDRPRRPPSDGEVFDELFRRHGRELYFYCLQRTRDVARAQDVHAAIFLEAWRRREEVDLISLPALPWLYGVAANLLRNEWRSARRRREALCRFASAEREDREGVAEQLERVELLAALTCAMRRLPAHHRRVLVLCVLEDRTYEAAASTLGVPVGTVRSRLARARAQLASEIDRPIGSSAKAVPAHHRPHQQRSASWPQKQTT